jgi:hypothetical protein
LFFVGWSTCGVVSPTNPSTNLSKEHFLHSFI